MKPREAFLAQEQARREELDRIRQSSKQSATIAALRRLGDALRHELDATEQRLEVALALSEPGRAKPAAPIPDAGKHHAAFVLLCSDWHVGERVDPASVSGRNEYTPAIAQRRVDKLIDGARWMLEAWRQGRGGYGWLIDRVVVWLGGDLMTGMIHDDLRESNLLSPTEEVLLAQQLCCQVIDALAAHPGVARVDVPTSWGNHGRDTPERRVSTAWKRSYEWLMYQQIARQYERSRKVVVHAGRDEISRLKVYNTEIRFNHGDIFRYQDGVGGITIPMRKWLAKLDRTQRADVTCVGHWHQYLDIGDAVVNNCLIGWNAYGQRVAPFSRPSQVCFLVDEKYGKRMSTEVFVG